MVGRNGRSEVIECISNGTMMISEYQWKKSGEAVLVILVYTNSSFNDSDYLDCGVTRVTVAGMFICLHYFCLFVCAP